MSVAVSSLPTLPSWSAAALGTDRAGGPGRRLFAVPDLDVPAAAEGDQEPWDDESYGGELSSLVESLGGLARLEAEILSL